MNKTEMKFQDVKEPWREWFEQSCMMWADHYSFMLSLSINTKEDEVWYKEHLNMNKIYDV